MKAKEEPCDKVCAIASLTDHYDWGGCGTPYCSGWSEYRCRECGWFNTHCLCGCSNGYSKISYKQEKAINRRRNKKNERIFSN